MHLQKYALKIKNIFHTHPLWVSSICLLLLFIILLLCDSNNWNDIKNDLISGTSTEILGAIITLWIVQVLFDKYNVNLAEKEERRKILNSYKIVIFYIKQYETLLCATINDYDDYDKNFRSFNLHQNFDITQLQYAHNNCLLLTKSAYFSNIHFFLKIEFELREQLISILQNIDFHYHDDIFQQIYGYIETSIKYDVRQAIEQNDNKIKQEMAQKSFEFRNFFKDIMVNNIKEFMDLLKDNKTTPSNIMYPYIVLYQMINIEKEYLYRYIELMEALKSND